MKFFKTTICSATSIAIATSTLHADFPWHEHYKIEDIYATKDIDFQIGGLDFDKEGNLVACFHRGEVAKYNSETKAWSIFATGLQEPLGIYTEEEGTILVVQRGELTRLHDKNNDGVADVYEVVSNDWGVSGNYHEFTFGIVKDSQKNIYLGLGTASNGSGVRKEIRGPWNNTGGLTQDKFVYANGKDWATKKEIIPRMYARVPYRGCVLKIPANSRKAEVFATGVRTPNGLYMDKNDQLWVSDNQGDWVGASKIHQIQKDGFHGHVASLLWAKNPPNETPAKMSVKKLNEMRIKSALLLPQGVCANSITQPQSFHPNFSPFKGSSEGQLICGEMNFPEAPRLVRYLPDVVNGKTQGTATHFLKTTVLGHGNNRILFSEDGKTLFVGKTHLSWPGKKGMKKITYTGKPYLFVENVKLTPTGFEFMFNTDISTVKSAKDVKISSYRIAYHANYGSGQMDKKILAVSSLKVDGNKLILELKDALVKDRVYDIELPSEITSELSDISYNKFWYTAHEIHEVK